MYKVFCLAVTAAGLFAVACVAANAWVIGASRAHVYKNIDHLPHNRVALVLGTSPWTRHGNKNLLFSHRIKGAAELYKAGKVEHLLLSGANPDETYNEPREMYQALLEAGVPPEAMTLDFAGLRTLDSIVRAHKVFGLERFTIVSQRYHDFRAVFIARKKGIDAVAYSRPEEDRRQPLRTEAREFLARIRALLDLYLLNAQPRFLGEQKKGGP